MIHAYVSIWRCLKSAHKGWKWKWKQFQPVYREYMKGEEGVWGAPAPRSQWNVKEVKIKWKLLLFDDGVGCGGLVVNTSDSGSRVAVLCP